MAQLSCTSEHVVMCNCVRHAGLLFIYLPSMIIFVVADVAFIATVAGPMFALALGDLLRPQPEIGELTTVAALTLPGTSVGRVTNLTACLHVQCLECWPGY
jgi:hypothetical protein